MRYLHPRLLLVALIVGLAIFGVTSTTGAQSETPKQQTQTAPPPAPAPAPPPPECATAKQHRSVIKKALRFSAAGGNFVARSSKKKIDQAAEMRACAKQHFPARYKAEKKAWRKRKRLFRWYAYIDRITPYGKWAIPPYIVNCESASSGFWRAANRSGAVGPYQLLGWGAPYPVRTVAQMAQHHIIAHRVWAGGRGASNWVCA